MILTLSRAYVIIARIASEEKDVGSEPESILLGGLRVRGSAGADKFSCCSFVIVFPKCNKKSIRS